MLYSLLDDNNIVMAVQDLNEKPENGVAEICSDGCLKAKFNHTTRTFSEAASEEEILAHKIYVATGIDEHYTKLIGAVQMKHVGKTDFEPGYVIPQIAHDEVDALRQQCNDEIFAATGLTDYTYRQSNPKLATFNL